MRFLVANLPRIFIAITGIVLIGAFQNCSNDMRFDAEGSLVAKGGDEGPNTGDGGGRVTDPSNRDPGSKNPVKNPGNNPGNNPSRDPGYSTPIVKNPGGGGGGCGSDNVIGGGTSIVTIIDSTIITRSGSSNMIGSNSAGNSAANTAGSDFLCVLGAERGVDVTVNYVFDGDESGASAPVCMSERACTQIAGGVFDVKAAKRSLDCSTQTDAAGYVKLSDGKVKEAVEKTKFYRQLKRQANMSF